jgi:hypothetical protein
MQEYAGLTNKIEAIIPDMKQEIYDRLTLSDLYLASGRDINLFRAYMQRGKDLSAALVQEALNLIPAVVLQNVSRIAHRGYREWQQRPGGNDFQNPLHLRFEGAGSQRPFPHTRFILPPDGRILPYPADVLGGPNVVFQPQHAYITSDRVGVPPGPPCRLRDANFLRACISINGSSVIDIHFHRRQENVQGRVLIYLNPVPVASYAAFCGALLHLFYSLSSPLSSTPMMLSQSELLLRLMQPRNLVLHAPLPFQREVREALALVILNLRAPGVIPSSSLEYFNADQFHNCPMQLVLFN